MFRAKRQYLEGIQLQRDPSDSYHLDTNMQFVNNGVYSSDTVDEATGLRFVFTPPLQPGLCSAFTVHNCALAASSCPRGLLQIVTHKDCGGRKEPERRRKDAKKPAFVSSLLILTGSLRTERTKADGGGQSKAGSIWTGQEPRAPSVLGQS